MKHNRTEWMTVLVYTLILNKTGIHMVEQLGVGCRTSKGILGQAGGSVVEARIVTYLFRPFHIGHWPFAFLNSGKTGIFFTDMAVMAFVVSVSCFNPERMGLLGTCNTGGEERAESKVECKAN